MFALSFPEWVGLFVIVAVCALGIISLAGGMSLWWSKRRRGQR